MRKGIGRECETGRACGTGVYVQMKDLKVEMGEEKGGSSVRSSVRGAADVCECEGS
jgi:hypothetical protein